MNFDEVSIDEWIRETGKRLEAKKDGERKARPVKRTVEEANVVKRRHTDRSGQLSISILSKHV